MPAQHAGSGPHARAAVPLWMRRGTLWTILVLATTATALIAYYLLPGWWAALVNLWVKASSPWLTGLILGFAMVSIGVTALRTALRIPADAQRAGAGLTRLILGVITAVALVALALTVFIALGITEPLSQARELWQHDAPGLLAATLVGALTAIILMLTLALLLRRQPQAMPAPPQEEAPGPGPERADDDHNGGDG